MHRPPDGLTPPNEGVCDDLFFATPGLYGLCIAYCEAQDWDEMTPEDVEQMRSRVPKDKILANYNRKMGADDPEMPCIQVPIPCWTQEELDSIGTYGGAISIYRHHLSSCKDQWYLEHRTDGAGGFYSAALVQDQILIEDEQFCRYIDTTMGVRREFAITQEQFAAARDEIIARAEVLSWGLWETIVPYCE